jgi:phage gpG-like protein
MGSVKLDLSGWKGLKKTLEGDYITRVGILGSEASKPHAKTKKTNAEIGAIHELGLVAGIPQRSFLKMPLETKLFSKIEAEKENYYNALKSGKLKKWFQAVGMWAEEIIDQAFTSSGFGSWAKNSPVTIKRKGSAMPLIDTGQLRNSITSTVINK